MNKPKGFINQFRLVKKLTISAKLYVSSIVLYGIFTAGWMLFFNFYILARGFDLNFLGIANSLTPAAMLVGGIPMGLLSDKIGRKKALLIGQVMLATSAFVATLANQGWVILLFLFTMGLGEAVIMVSEAPMLMKLSTRETQGILFSMNYGLATLAGMLGSFLGGQLPLWMNSALNVQPETAASYQGVLLVSASFNLLSFIPLLLLKIPEGERETPLATKVEVQAPPETRLNNKEKVLNILRNPVSWKLILPNLGFGIGAALFIPYINLFLSGKFAISNQVLGTIYSLGSLTTGLGMLLSSTLSERVGSRIRAIFLVQTISIAFMIMLGFSPWLGIAIFGYMVRGALMNMAAPMYDSFSMDQVSEKEQATFYSLLVMTFQVGWAIGPFLSTLLQKRYDFSVIFILSIICYSISIFAFWVNFHKKVDVQQAEAIRSISS